MIGSLRLTHYLHRGLTHTYFFSVSCARTTEPLEVFELEEEDEEEPEPQEEDDLSYLGSWIQSARELAVSWGSVTGSSSSWAGNRQSSNNRQRNRQRQRNNNGFRRSRNRSRNNNNNVQRSSGAVDCTRSPVGVSFSTPGGNFGFGICRDGSTPSAAAQGATIWDPNERRAFQGNCQYVDRMARQGYMANNMCGITRIRLDGPCCSAPTHTSGSLGQSWTACRGSC